MNKCILIGRLVRTPEVRYTQGAEAKAVCKFTIAVDRPYRGDNDRAVDFLNCVCFGKRGEAIGKYFDKGNKIAVTGRIQTGEYTDKQGIKISIHTPRVGSDNKPLRFCCKYQDFNPHSPCGE